MAGAPSAVRNRLPLVLALLASAAVALLILRPGELGPDVLAMDSFDRTVADGWAGDGQAGLWALSGTRADYHVTGGTGVIVVPQAGLTRTALLNSIVERDVDVTFSFSLDKEASAAGSYVYAIMRHSDPQHEYRAKVRFAAGGGVYLGATATLASQERELSPETRVSGLAYVPGLILSLRARLEGDPAALRIKLWPSSSAEPVAWTMRANAPRRLLDAPGSVGLQVYVSKSSAGLPVTFTFGQFDARRLASPSGSGGSARPGSSASGRPSTSP